jgi:16S rRNA (guanine527-N7)-methyltransferase
MLASGLAALGLDTPDSGRRKLLDYIELVVKWNRVHNLTAVHDRCQMVSRHLLDSLAVAPHVEGPNLLDVGSGAGLPGIPLAIQFPNMQVTLIDSSHKKAAFLRQAVIDLGVANANVICERVESWRPAQPFECVITRAFSSVSEFLRRAGHTCSARGVLAAMKGVIAKAEVDDLPAGFRLRNVVPLMVPGLSAVRHLVLVERVA